MKKAANIEITDEEEATLQAAQRVAETIAARYEDATGERMDMKMDVKPDYTGKFNAWWKVCHGFSWKLSGHNMSLRGAIAEMAGTTDADLKRKTAEDLRRRADELEKEAAEWTAKSA